MAVEVLVPPLGTNVDTVTITAWHRADGEAVAAGDPLFSVETDKATLEVESPASGTLRAVGAKVGDEVEALSRIAWIAAPGEALPGDDVSGPREEPRADAPRGRAVPGAGGSRIFASPRARRMAEERGVDWRALAGTGPEGAVVERDVRAALEAPPTPRPTPLARRVAAEAGVAMDAVRGTGAGGRVTRVDVARAARGAGEADETIAMSGIRGRIAERMLRGARETATVTLTTEVDATGLVEARSALTDEGLRVSYNDLLLAITARALREHPRLNASLEGEQILTRAAIDIALAVDTERGLLAPVLRGVDRLSLAEIAAGSAALIERARDGQAGPDELRGSSFTLTNLGMFGIDSFTPIINVPECAILGVGRIKPSPAVVDGRLAVRQMLWLSLSFDHRLVDGGPAARFLQRIAALVQAPARLLHAG